MTKQLKVLLLVAAISGMAVPAFAEHSQDNILAARYRNVAGSTLTSGTAVVFTYTDSNTTTGTYPTSASTIGLDVTTTTIADNAQFAGVLLDNECADDQVCRFVIYGPAITRWAGGTDDTDQISPTGSVGEVGTTTVAGLLGGGSNAGRLLSTGLQGSNDESDGSLVWVFVNAFGSKD